MFKADCALVWVVVLTIMPAGAGLGADKMALPSTADHQSHQESARQSERTTVPDVETPPLPEGMTLDEVLEYSASPPPAAYPVTVADDRIYAFMFIEQLEYRFTDDNASDHLGWEAQGWIGRDFNKFWWKNEGEAVFDGEDEGESETDLLYSRQVTPFWNFQVGAQYANESTSDEYDDRWSAVIAFQGLAPYKFELDQSLYLSEKGDVTFVIEAEYDLRITQRLVLQPRTELGFSATDIPERAIGAGMTDADFDLRLRYEIKREFAPYIGIRYHIFTGETGNIAEAAGEDSEQVYFVTGARLAF